jgi:hypothetical protein
VTPSPESSANTGATPRRRNAVTKMQNRPEAGAALLRDLRALFRERGAERLPTAAIVVALGARHGRPITAHRLARLLKPSGATPRQFRAAGRRMWGGVLPARPARRWRPCCAGWCARSAAAACWRPN